MLRKVAVRTPFIKHFLNMHNKLFEIKDELARMRDSARTDELVDLLRMSNDIGIENYMYRLLRDDEKYKHPKNLNRFEFQVYSQNGEDGILSEIFERIGVSNEFFVEFGVGNGIENNTTYLLSKNWHGAWMEADPERVEDIKKTFARPIAAGSLSVKNAVVTADNVQQLFQELHVPQEFDLLSIDIDGNDYWVWKAIEDYSPRVVVVEYNALYRPPTKWVMKYNPEHGWNGSSHMGASLKSLEVVGREKGYCLVGCELIGINSFFVRNDLVGDHFMKPFTAENHYEPPRYHILKRASKFGHCREFGDFEAI
jgi:hypothetical protein